MNNTLPFIYGTAWKGKETAELVSSALASGFLALDTAAQPKHYREDLAGVGLRAALSKLPISREDLFVSPLLTHSPLSPLPTPQESLTNTPSDPNKVHPSRLPRPLELSLPPHRSSRNTNPHLCRLLPAQPAPPRRWPLIVLPRFPALTFSASFFCRDFRGVGNSLFLRTHQDPLLRNLKHLFFDVEKIV
jgi:hypothetical protein